MSVSATTCECGQKKRRADEACRRCTELDGGSRTNAQVISALRSVGPRAFVRDVVEATGLHRNTVDTALKELYREGRVRQRMVEVDEADGWRMASYTLSDNRFERRAKYRCMCGAHFGTRGGYERHSKPHPVTGQSKCRKRQ